MRAEFPSGGCFSSAGKAIGTIQDLVDSGILVRSENNVKIASAGSFHLAYLASLLWRRIDTYLVTAIFLHELTILLKGLPSEKLLKKVRILGESLYAARLITGSESCSQAGIKTAVRVWRDRQVLEVRKVAGVKRVVLSKEFAQEAKLQELADQIGTFRQATPVKAVHQDVSKLLFANFPPSPTFR